MENCEICHCMKVSYADVEKAMHETDNISDVTEAFKHVQQVSHE